MKRSRFSQPSRRSALWPLVCLGIIVASYFWSNRVSTSPANALARVQELLDKNELQQVQPLLAVALQDPQVAPWAMFLRAKLFERLGKTDQAIGAYSSISPNAPASLDATVALLRLGKGLVEGVTLPGTDSEISLDAFSDTLMRNRRSDLLGQFLEIQGRTAEERGDRASAIADLQHSREVWPKNPALEELRSLTRSLLEILKTDDPRSIELHFQETKLLLAEDKPDEALKVLQDIQPLLQPQSESFFQARLLEVQIMRQQKRASEADHLLLEISADAPETLASQALFQVMKNTWNLNDNTQALQYIDRFRERFPKSSLRAEVDYIEARIDEEMNRPSDAKLAYERQANAAHDGLSKIRAHRRIAWLYMVSQNYSLAKQYFSVILQEAETELHRTPSKENAALSGDSYAQLHDERAHALYWFAYCTLRGEGDEDASPPNPTDLSTAKNSLQKLISEYPVSYYAFRGAELAHDHFPELTEAWLAPEQISKSDDCFLQIPEGLVAQANTLSAAHLEDLTEHEVEWYFSHHGFASSAQNELEHYPQTQLSASSVRFLASKAKIYDLAHVSSRSIPISRLLFRPEVTSDSALISECQNSFLSLAYPLAFDTPVRQAAKKSHLSASLLRALAHTESNFDAQAVSPKGAMGLVQLLPNTAKEVGFVDGQDLFNPKLNLEIAARHIAQLLKENTAPEYAIAAYNAGRGAVGRWKTRFPDLDPNVWIELITYPETQNYVKKVLLAQVMYEKLTEKSKANLPSPSTSDETTHRSENPS